MKLFITLTMIISLSLPMNSWAFLGDGGAGWAQIPYLVKILSENIKRYQQLRSVIHQAKNHEQYLHLINSGLENSMGLLESLPIEDNQILAELRDFKNSYDTILDVYGKIPRSKDAAMQMLHDQTIAETFQMINSFKKYSKEQEENAEIIRTQSRDASPKGAARMMAESNALVLKSMSQLIRLQGQGLKLQSEQFAMNNKSEKESVGSFQKINTDLGKGFEKFKMSKKLPKF